MRRIGRAFRDNGLALAFGVLFIAALIGQALAGLADFNNQLLSRGLDQVGFWRYVTSSDFAVDVAENWQSEYLQFFLYIMATVYLVQRGSPESKPLDQQGRESDREQKIAEHSIADSPSWAKSMGLRLTVFSGHWGW